MSTSHEFGQSAPLPVQSSEAMYAPGQSVGCVNSPETGVFALIEAGDGSADQIRESLGAVTRMIDALPAGNVSWAASPDEAQYWTRNVLEGASSLIATGEKVGKCAAAIASVVRLVDGQNGEKIATWSSVGDIRIYHVSDDTVRQITTDEGDNHQELTNWLGDESKGVSQTDRILCKPGDRLFIVNNAVVGDASDVARTPDELKQIVNGHDASEAAQTLLAAAVYDKDRAALVIDIPLAPEATPLEPAELKIPDPHTDILGFFNFIRKVDETPVRLEAAQAHNEALAKKKASHTAKKKELHEQPIEITSGDLIMQELAARRKAQREADHAKRIKSLFQPDAEVVALQAQPLVELKRQADEKKRSDIDEFNDVAARFRRRFASEQDIEVLVPYDKTKERKPGEKPLLVQQKGRMTYEIVKLTHGWILGKLKTNVDGGNSSQQDVVVLGEDGKVWYGATSEDRFEGRTIAVRGDGTFIEDTLDYVADKARIDYILGRDTGAKYMYGARDFMKKKLGIA